MGCVPRNRRNIELNPPGGNGDENRDSLPQSLKINKKQFVLEFASDPYEKYTKIEALGEGSYGRVYKVEEKNTKNL